MINPVNLSTTAGPRLQIVEVGGKAENEQLHFSRVIFSPARSRTTSDLSVRIQQPIVVPSTETMRPDRGDNRLTRLGEVKAG